MLSSFAWVMIVILLMIIKYIFILPREDKQLFELYESRDDISIEAMRDDKMQETIEYEYVVNNLNFWIYNTKHDYDFSVAISNIVRFAKKFDQEKISKVFNNINNIEVLRKGLNKISSHSMRIMRIKGRIFHNCIVLFFTIIYYIIYIIEKVCNIGHSTKEKVKRCVVQSKQTKEDYDNYISGLLSRKI